MPQAMSAAQSYRVREILRDSCLEFGNRLPTEPAARSKLAELIHGAESGRLDHGDSLLISDLAIALLGGF